MDWRFPFFLVLFFISSFCSFAEDNYKATHCIEVGRLSQWAPEYLTVTNNWNNLCIVPQPRTFGTLSVITKINGKSTKDMEPEDFYDIIDTSNPFTLTYITKKNGKNQEYEETFTPRKGELLVRKDDPSKLPQSLSLLSDNDVDFFKFNTFDYLIAGDDPLMDKTIMELFAEQLRSKGLKRDKETPDIYLYVSKDVSNRIESVYVPSYTTTTQTQSGSTGVDLGRLIGLNGVSVGGSSGNATTTTVDNGQMKTNVSADAFLEVSILDASKLGSDTPPIIWQFTFNDHRTSKINLLDEVRNWMASWMALYPTHNEFWSFGALTWGVLCDKFEETGRISEVIPGSTAEKLGVRQDDIIKYVKYNTGPYESYVFRPGEPFYGDMLLEKCKLVQVGKRKFTKDGMKERIEYQYINHKF